MTRRMPLAVALMTYAIYIIVPTPDELALHPFVGYIFTRLFDVNIQTGILWSVGFYNSLGVVLLGVSLLIGGRVLLDEMRRNVGVQSAQLVSYVSRRLMPGPSPDAGRSEGFYALAGSYFELFD